MPPFYDIYGLSKHRDKQTIERFLNNFSNREKIEDRSGQEIAVYKNEKYQIEETYIAVSTLSEVIDYGLSNYNHGFSFYIADNLKKGISHIILKFTYDGKIIFGISIEETKINESGRLIDNFCEALKIEKLIAELTNSTKTSIQFEYAPSDDEEEFNMDIEMWKNMSQEKQNNRFNVSIL